MPHAFCGVCNERTNVNNALIAVFSKNPVWKVHVLTHARAVGVPQARIPAYQLAQTRASGGSAISPVRALSRSFLAEVGEGAVNRI